MGYLHLDACGRLQCRPTCGNTNCILQLFFLFLKIWPYCCLFTQSKKRKKNIWLNVLPQCLLLKWQCENGFSWADVKPWALRTEQSSISEWIILTRWSRLLSLWACICLHIFISLPGNRMRSIHALPFRGESDGFLFFFYRLRKKYQGKDCSHLL